MKNFILIVSSILLFSCTPQKNVTSSGGNSVTSKTTNKGMRMHGKVITKSETAADGKSEYPVLYFDNGVAYLINFAESKVSKEDIQQYVYKDIDIFGEIKSGNIAIQSKDYKNEEQSVKETRYIIIYKIL
jgi:hypothetical protein